MSEFEHSRASLRFSGEDLVPDEVTALLGASPTKSRIKGQEIAAGNSGDSIIAKRGFWRLQAERREPEDLEGQILKYWRSSLRISPYGPRCRASSLTCSVVFS